MLSNEHTVIKNLTRTQLSNSDNSQVAKKLDALDIKEHFFQNELLRMV